MSEKVNHASPLPDGWDMAQDIDGKLYFIDHNSKKTTWVDPRERMASCSDCASDESAVVWESGPESPSVGPIHHTSPTANSVCGRERSREEWRQLQERMLADYLDTAQQHLRATQQIFTLKEQRLRVAQRECHYLNSSVATALGHCSAAAAAAAVECESCVAGAANLPNASATNSSARAVPVANGNCGTRYDPTVLKAELQAARRRVQNLRTELTRMRSEMSEGQRGIESFGDQKASGVACCSTSSAATSSSYGSLLSVSTAQAVLAELGQIDRSLLCGQREKQQLIQSLSQLRHELRPLTAGQLSPEAVDSAGGYCGSQTDLSADLRPLGERLVEVSRLRAQYDRCRRQLLLLQQQLVDVETTLQPDSSQSDKDRLLLIQEKEQYLRELQTLLSRHSNRTDPAAAAGGAVGDSCEELEQLRERVCHLHVDIQNAIELNNRTIAERLRMHERRQCLLVSLRDAALAAAQCELRLRSSASQLSSVSSSSGQGSMASLCSQLSGHSSRSSRSSLNCGGGGGGGGGSGGGLMWSPCPPFTAIAVTTATAVFNTITTTATGAAAAGGGAGGFDFSDSVNKQLDTGELQRRVGRLLQHQHHQQQQQQFPYHSHHHQQHQQQQQQQHTMYGSSPVSHVLSAAPEVCGAGAVSGAGPVPGSGPALMAPIVELLSPAISGESVTADSGVFETSALSSSAAAAAVATTAAATAAVATITAQTASDSVQYRYHNCHQLQQPQQQQQLQLQLLLCCRQEPHPALCVHLQRLCLTSATVASSNIALYVRVSVEPAAAAAAGGAAGGSADTFRSRTVTVVSDSATVAIDETVCFGGAPATFADRHLLFSVFSTVAHCDDTCLGSAELGLSQLHDQYRAAHWCTLSGTTPLLCRPLSLPSSALSNSSHMNTRTSQSTACDLSISPGASLMLLTDKQQQEQQQQQRCGAVAATASQAEQQLLLDASGCGSGSVCTGNSCHSSAAAAAVPTAAAAAAVPTAAGAGENEAADQSENSLPPPTCHLAAPAVSWTRTKQPICSSVTVKRSHTFSPSVVADNVQLQSRLNRSGSDSAIPGQCRDSGRQAANGSFLRGVLARRSLRRKCGPAAGTRAGAAGWRQQHTAPLSAEPRTSLELELQLQTQQLRLDQLQEELASLREIKARAETVKQSPDLASQTALVDRLVHKLDRTALLSDEQLVESRRVDRVIRRVSRDVQRLFRAKTSSNNNNNSSSNPAAGGSSSGGGGHQSAVSVNVQNSDKCSQVLRDKMDFFMRSVPSEADTIETAAAPSASQTTTLPPAAAAAAVASAEQLELGCCSGTASNRSTLTRDTAPPTAAAAARATPTPHNATPTPHNATPSPHNVTPTPHNATPISGHCYRQLMAPTATSEAAAAAAAVTCDVTECCHANSSLSDARAECAAGDVTESRQRRFSYVIDPVYGVQV